MTRAVQRRTADYRDAAWLRGRERDAVGRAEDQKLPQYEAVANDLALAASRCTLFGIKPEECL